MKLSEATYWIGGLTAVAGLVGISLGAWLADALLRYTRRAYLLWCSVAVTLAVPFGAAGILVPTQGLSLGLMFVAMVLMASVLGPCNTVTANVVPATQRAAGYAVSIFMIHMFGDISSPILIGNLSEWFGRPSVVESPLGYFLASLGAHPVDSTNLAGGMLSLIPMLALGGLFFLIGSRYLAADQDRARHLSGGGSGDEFLLH
jgi:MFS transporter, Spinster family, sphingosine-1-phosphate transporter